MGLKFLKKLPEKCSPLKWLPIFFTRQRNVSGENVFRLKPGFTACSRTRLWINKPDAISNAMAIAVSDEAKKLCVLLLPTPVILADFNASFTLMRAERHAGAIPNKTAVAQEMSTANSKTVPSM